ncbi:hypothetical protein AVEN_25863-1 [Araneus ventricosus]|uniref:Uncharacterized protein n=1 Tax=Araneus ventricosus TaxID=182803 RepID=A0A4Y2U7W8_ARAVE|nr:hypothetical protein AVEN_25863-1 [Araneus ventricosus]
MPITEPRPASEKITALSKRGTVLLQRQNISSVYEEKRERCRRNFEPARKPMDRDPSPNHWPTCNYDIIGPSQSNRGQFLYKLQIYPSVMRKKRRTQRR